MEFEANSKNEIIFVDGAELSLSRKQKNLLSSAAAHFIDCFSIETELDVYISKKSVLHKNAGASALAWHMAPQYSRKNHIVCVFVDPEESLKSMVISLAHEIIHAWQVERGDFDPPMWKGEDYSSYPYLLQPWELEAFNFMEAAAGYYFNDSYPSFAELEAVMSQTATACEEVRKNIGTASLKSKIKKVSAVAGMVGLAVLIS